MLLSLAPFPFCTRLFVMSMCFAANTGFVQCFEFSLRFSSLFADVRCYQCRYASPRKHRACKRSLPLFRTFIVMSLCLALHTTDFDSASLFVSFPLLHTFICYLSVLHLPNNGFVFVSLPMFAHVYLLCQCASPCKHQVCVVLLFSVPFPFCIRLFVMSACFALQTRDLCSASVFGSLPLLHTFVCNVSVLGLANTWFV